MHPPRSSLSVRIFWWLSLVSLTVAAFSYPEMPSLGLDASWHMALGRFFFEGRQFGTEVVFTYGPLGWLLGNMYWGGQWWSLLLWPGLVAVLITALILRNALLLSWPRRILFVLFFLLVGLRYGDIAQQAAIAMIGFELIRREQPRWHPGTLVFTSLLALFSLIKFTNLVLACCLLGIACIRPGFERRWRAALIDPVCYLSLLLLGWMLCGQNPLHLPAYFLNSWQISSGYQDAMGVSCSTAQLYYGLAVAATMSVYLLVCALTAPHRLRGVTLALGALTFLFLNWKHGFIRADGHQLVFYFSALLLAFGSPLFLDEGRRLRWLKQVVLVAAAVLAWCGAEGATPGLTRGALATLQAKYVRTITLICHPLATHQSFDEALISLRREVDLPLSRSVIGDRPMDLLGFEQDVAILNQFNYVPRPVFQSYSAYTPRLADLNLAYYESDRAPEFVLFKLQTIDNRLATMDEARVIDLLTRRYRYLVTEHGFSLWQRRPPADPHPVAFPPLRTVSTHMGDSVDISGLHGDNLWLHVDYHLTLLGQLRRFLFKPPLVWLRLTDESHATSRYLLPLPIGKTGFLVSPIVSDVAEFLRAANGEPGRRVAALAVEVAPQDRDCFQDDVTLSLSSVPLVPGVGWAALPLGHPDIPLTFVRGHVRFGAQLSYIDGKLLYFAHAPSSLVYRSAAGATVLQGNFGFYDGAYAPQNATPTDGAEFIVRWLTSDGNAKILFRRVLQPLKNPKDRGRQSFQVCLPDTTHGELEFAITSGPDGGSSSDWTYWHDLRLEKPPKTP